MSEKQLSSFPRHSSTWKYTVCENHRHVLHKSSPYQLLLWSLTEQCKGLWHGDGLVCPWPISHNTVVTFLASVLKKQLCSWDPSAVWDLTFLFRNNLLKTDSIDRVREASLLFYMDTFQKGGSYGNVTLLCDTVLSLWAQSQNTVHISYIRENGSASDFRSVFLSFTSPSNCHIFNQKDQHSKLRAEPL